MATMAELEQALINADKAGDLDAARRLAAVLSRAQQDSVNRIPGMPIAETMPTVEKPSIGQNIIGAGEAALTTVTGATGGAIGMLGGTVKGLAEQILSGEFGSSEAADLVEKSAMEGAQSLTYLPHTQSGREQVQAIGEVLGTLPPVVPTAGQVGSIGAAAAAGARRVGQAGAKIAQAVSEVVPSITRRSAATDGSIGAAAIDPAAVRQSLARELPVPIELTTGQKTRQFAQQRFERETAKLPEVGAPLRERFSTQNMQLLQNLEAFIDKTGSETSDLRSIGLSVDKAIRDRAARDKTRIRTLYKDAEKAGELEAPVKLDSVATFLNENVPEAEVANVLKAARAKALQLGIVSEDTNGMLTSNSAPLKSVELFRRSIGAATNDEPTNMHFASQIRGLVDSATEGLGGNLYKKARAARAKFGSDYENIGLVKNILGLKRGSSDRAIALEDILRRSVVDPSTSLDTVRQVRRLLQTEGSNGQQAWKELQGGTIKFLRDEATKNVARDENGSAILSPAQLDRVLAPLDRSGKLDFIFGKKGAEQLRLLNDVAKDVMVAPPGVVNTSNTASVLAGMMDVAISGTSGVPAPIMTSFRLLSKGVKDAKIKARVKRALGEQ